MAIQFARVTYLSRATGGNAVQTAAYNARTQLFDERTGEQTHDHSKGGDLEHHEIMGPTGIPDQYMQIAYLWNKVEDGERRKDSQVARHLILAMPNDQAITLAHRIALAQSFVDENYVSHGLVAQIDLHKPHDGQTNWHAHVLITTRRVNGDGLSRYKARDLDPEIRRGRYGHRFVAEGEMWGRLWGEHQQRYFKQQQLDIQVDPIAVIPGMASYGPKRSWRGAKADVPEQIAELKQKNAEAVQNPSLVLEHLQRTQQHLDSRYIAKFLSKHANPQEREEIHNQVLKLQRQALEKATWADKVPSGWRTLTLEDVARELSPDYAKLEKQWREIQEQFPAVDKKKRANEGWAEAAKARVENRWGDMGLLKRGLHFLGHTNSAINGLKDTELHQWNTAVKRAEWGLNFWSIRGATLAGDLNVVRRAVADEWAKRDPVTHLSLRERAEIELQRRKLIAHNARQALRDNQKQTYSQTYSRRHAQPP